MGPIKKRVYPYVCEFVIAIKAVGYLSHAYPQQTEFSISRGEGRRESEKSKEGQVTMCKGLKKLFSLFGLQIKNLQKKSSPYHLIKDVMMNIHFE